VKIKQAKDAGSPDSSAIGATEDAGMRRFAAGQADNCARGRGHYGPGVAMTYAAALTPLGDGGGALDEAAFPQYLDFLHRGGLDGILALGSTGEGILLDTDERMRAAELFLDGPLDVIVHCGAQTTLATAELAGHAAENQAAGVAVIAPPYFQLDERALLDHFAAAARACDPQPFYVYEFARASGYAVPTDVIERLRERAPNLAGMKVSDSPWEAFQPYLLEGLDVFVGPEALIAQGLEHGAVGAVSALASALPEKVVRVDPRLGEIRTAIERFPRHAALKRIAARRGVPIREDVRAPLRGLTADERTELDAWLDDELS
jgi:dihydrodipicolinate synthase/N-acetylneuraminate lyase